MVYILRGYVYVYIYIHVRYPHQRNLLIRAGNLLLSGMFLTLDA
jgi:hypothetical protein